MLVPNLPGSEPVGVNSPHRIGGCAMAPCSLKGVEPESNQHKPFTESNSPTRFSATPVLQDSRRCPQWLQHNARAFNRTSTGPPPAAFALSPKSRRLPILQDRVPLTVRRNEPESTPERTPHAAKHSILLTGCANTTVDLSASPRTLCRNAAPQRKCAAISMSVHPHQRILRTCNCHVLDVQFLFAVRLQRGAEDEHPVRFQSLRAMD